MDRDRPPNDPATRGRIGRIVVRAEFAPLLSVALPECEIAIVSGETHLTAYVREEAELFVQVNRFFRGMHRHPLSHRRLGRAQYCAHLWSLKASRGKPFRLQIRKQPGQSLLGFVFQTGHASSTLGIARDRPLSLRDLGSLTVASLRPVERPSRATNAPATAPRSRR
jgi:hypothetical protein